MSRKDTRKIIVEALIRLVSKKPYDKITVQNIAEEADISKVTFYKYFKSKEELYSYATYEEGRKNFENLSKQFTWNDLILSNIRTNRTLSDSSYNIFVNYDAYGNYMDVLIQNNEELVKGYIAKHYGEEVLDEELSVILRTYLYGFLSMLRDDVVSGNKSDPEKLADYLSMAMPEKLKRYMPVRPE